jgi:hypothetical protein
MSYKNEKTANAQFPSSIFIMVERALHELRSDLNDLMFTDKNIEDKYITKTVPVIKNFFNSAKTIKTNNKSTESKNNKSAES